MKEGGRGEGEGGERGEAGKTMTFGPYLGTATEEKRSEKREKVRLAVGQEEKTRNRNRRKRRKKVGNTVDQSKRRSEKATIRLSFYIFFKVLLFACVSSSFCFSHFWWYCLSAKQDKTRRRAGRDEIID